MRIVHPSLLTVALFCPLASAQWDVSPDCRRRRIFDPNEPIMGAVMKRSESVSPEKSLRGSEASANRQLQQGGMMLRMHWEPGYCWQDEWKERKWCLKCDGSCNEGENLEINECDENEETQWFVYESANNGIKLKPFLDQSLCWTRTEGPDHRLMPCGSDNLDDNGLDKQIIIGFQETGSFELHPNGHSGQCLVNDDHHPRWDETIRAFDCNDARYFRTSLWEVYTSVQDNGNANNGAGDLPAIKNMGLGYCTVDSPCGLCTGDCNNHEDCENGLVCYKRQRKEEVPFCRRGLNDGSTYDYCTYPPP